MKWTTTIRALTSEPVFIPTTQPEKVRSLVFVVARRLKVKIITRKVKGGLQISRTEPTEVERAIKDMEFYRQTHIDWAEYFEKYPEMEAKYEGIIQPAEEQRDIVKRYDRVLKLLRNYRI